LYAVTVHEVGWVTVSDAPVTVHPVPETEYVTAPCPDPPDVVSVMGVPATPDVGALEIVRVDCAAAVNVNDTRALVAVP